MDPEWSELRNPAYDFYGVDEDCTNFVSQVLHDSAAGGLPYVHNDNWGFDYKDSDNWYYADGRCPEIKQDK